MSDITPDQPISEAIPNRTEENPHSRLHIDWVVHAGEWSSFEPLDQLVSQVTAAFDCVDLDWPAAKCETALALSDDKAVQALNREFRQLNTPTNVLSFPSPRIAPSIADPYFLGDVILARETVLREARDRDLEPQSHLAHLIVHGILHLFGHDHEEPAEAKVMEGIEIRMLAKLGIGNPYDEYISQ